MFDPFVTLDAAMTAASALRRLAVHGYWSSLESPVVRKYLEAQAEVRRGSATRELAIAGGDDSLPNDAPRDEASLTWQELATAMERSPQFALVAIRREVGLSVLWYAFRMVDVFSAFEVASAEETVAEALSLHKSNATETVQESQATEARDSLESRIVLSGHEPVSVRYLEPSAPTGAGQLGFGLDGAVDRDEANSNLDEILSEMSPRGVSAKAEPKVVVVEAHPYVEAPSRVEVGEKFIVTVGLTDSPQPEVASTGALVLNASEGVKNVAVEVCVIADGLTTSGPWRKTLVVEVARPTAARVSFEFVALAQTKDVRFTSIVVEFCVDGVLRGSGVRHLVVAAAGKGKKTVASGIPWLGSEPPPPSLNLTDSGRAADIELDILKLDGNVARGRFNCAVRNAHGVPVPDGPIVIDLGEDDAAAFAQHLIRQMSQWSGKAASDLLIRGHASTVADALPDEFWDVLSAVGEKVKDRPITLQLTTEEPFVPWELAFVEKPVDQARPPFLAAQVVMGRWIKGRKIPATPKTALHVSAMAVIAGQYWVNSLLQELPRAVEEAKTIVGKYKSPPAYKLDCTIDKLTALMSASIYDGFNSVGGVQVVHFAGHGEVNTTEFHAASLYLNDGSAFTPEFFRNTELGSRESPFVFLNACMVGAGNAVLGTTGGFPGSCIRGGFSGLIGPLFSVNDEVAKDVALEFYEKALDGNKGRPVAEVLRDVRGRYDRNNPKASLLSYVFYGSPFLRLSADKEN